MPEDEDDLAYFLANLPAEIPVTVIGLGSNLIVRDGGVAGVVIRLGRGFGEVEGRRRSRPRRRGGARREGRARGAGGRHRRTCRSCAAFPGAIGGALRMNGGAYGRETKDALIEARGVDRARQCPRASRNADMRLHLPALRRARRCHLHRGAVPGRAAATRPPSRPRWTRSPSRARRRSRSRAAPAARPSRTRPAHKAWQLIDAAGCRGLRVGDAQVSEMHCNFLINLGSATAADIETLGETVRARVKETSGVELEWEIKRIGLAK